MSNFYKSEDCPSSPQLLDFQNGDMLLAEGKLIREHLTACEFCAAEVEFYEHYPQSDEPIEVADIPKPLYELAESLLSSKRNKISSLDSLLNDADEKSTQ